MTAKQLYDHITKQMPAEQALLKLLESALLTYEKLKFPEGSEPVHPLVIIANATMDLGWEFLVEKNTENVEGLIIGTQQYIERTIKAK